MPKVPFLYIPEKFCVKVFRPFIGIAKLFSAFVPGLKYDLEQMDSSLKAEEYTLLVLVHTFLYVVLFTGLLVFLLTTQEKAAPEIVQLGVLIFFSLFVLFFLVFIRYPKIIAGKKAEQIDKTLVFALKDIYLQVSSGVSLYQGLVHVSVADYGIVSKEFTIVVQDINRGLAMDVALERLAKRSKSEYLRRVLWQLVNTMKAGASLKGALTTIIEDLSRVQRTKIKDYAQELNLWSLLYMLFAVAIPTIGATMLVILSSFSGFKVTPITFSSFMGITLFVQLALIGFINSRRPIAQY